MGPIQRQVLRVLYVADLAGLGPMRTKDIAKVLSDVWRPTTWGAVQGAISGMRSYQNRYWLRSKRVYDRDKVTFTDYLGRPFYDYETFYSITRCGRCQLACQCSACCFCHCSKRRA